MIVTRIVTKENLLCPEAEHLQMYWTCAPCSQSSTRTAAICWWFDRLESPNCKLNFWKKRHSNKGNFYNHSFVAEHTNSMHGWKLDCFSSASRRMLCHHLGPEATSVCYCWHCAEKVWKFHTLEVDICTIESKPTIVWRWNTWTLYCTSC